MRLARKLSGLLFLIYSPAAVAVNHNIFVSAAGGCTGNGTAARPFVRLTDALAQVRALRASGQTDTINIHVAPGQYVVSRTPQGCGTEPLPIIINVSDVTILGATELVLDAETNTPSAALPGGSEFLAAQTLIGGEALVLLTPGTDGLPPQRVRVLGLSLTGSNLGGHGFFVDRAQDFLLQGNVTTHFSNGIRTRGASGELRGNLSLDNHDTGMVITAGSSIYPAAVRVTENRTCGA